ncbi:hypothetical protein EZS27_029758 [termite gut metagenome]|uniref:Uncharacterized protein n=1 Tax=termite gut metagenome TaxID=433724 RepID=A0A5J4QHS7_9ZZZZ
MEINPVSVAYLKAFVHKFTKYKKPHLLISYQRVGQFFLYLRNCFISVQTQLQLWVT